MITAPFNFVPLSEKVFFPDWADDVSHDVPFEDSQSGSIDITITAKSPIFIRDHEKQEEFCQHNGQYYIPSSSVKGMIRNVLEIMSFSKMSQFNDDTYAVRDLSSASNFYMTEMKENVLCGWLYKDGDDYMIEDCGEAYRISHQEIDKALDINFSSKFTRSGFEKTSEYKYNLSGGTHKKVKVGEPYKSKTNAKYDKRLFCKHDSSGKTGILVLTGQPTVRKNTGKKGDGKGFEFIFFEGKRDIELSKKVFEDFLSAYFNNRDTEPKESPDWTYWKKKLEDGKKVPVFFQKNGEEVAHFGLSYLYKLPYRYSVKDGVYGRHENNKKLDLAQTMFGFIDEDNALKGRIQFSHFKAEGNPVSIETKHEILGTPRASYYPIYVKQNPNNLFTTFMDDGFSIAGWKRYPVQCGLKSYPAPIDKYGKVNKNVGTTFTPLKGGTVFSGKLRYHNLTKSELGALLSALTFHNTQNCLHNIGMAKSLGYGKIELKVDAIELEEYLKVFELKINEQIENWHNQEQLLEFLTMATEQKRVDSSIWKYMSLTQFTDHKKRGQEEYLNSYSKFDNISKVSVKSLLSKEELNTLREIQKELKEKDLLEEKEYEEELLLERKKKEEQVKEEKKIRDEKEKKTLQVKKIQNELKLILNSDNPQILQNFIEKYPNHEKIGEIKSKKDGIENAKKENKHKEVNEKADRAYDALQKKESNQKQYLKEKDKFIKKWSKDKENKGSEYISELIKKLK